MKPTHKTNTQTVTQHTHFSSKYSLVIQESNNEKEKIAGFRISAWTLKKNQMIKVWKLIGLSALDSLCEIIRKKQQLVELESKDGWMNGWRRSCLHACHHCVITTNQFMPSTDNIWLSFYHFLWVKGELGEVKPLNWTRTSLWESILKTHFEIIWQISQAHSFSWSFWCHILWLWKHEECIFSSEIII